MTPEELRRLAIEEALRRHPELVNASGADELARLNAIASELEPEIQVKYELEEIRRREFAEQAASQQRVAKEAKEAERRKKAEEERLRREEQERQRQEQLRKEAEQRKKEQEEKHRKDEERIAAMPPLRRFIRRNWIAVSAAALVFIVAPLVAASWFGYRAFERNQLLASCDPTQIRTVQEIADDWADRWINCPDPDLREMVVTQAPAAFFTRERVADIARNDSTNVLVALLESAPVGAFTNEAFGTLVDKQSDDITLAILSRSDVDDDSMLALAASASEPIQLNMVAEPSMSPTVLEFLARNGTEEVQVALLERKELPVNALTPLIERIDLDLLIGVSLRSDLSQDAAAAIVQRAAEDQLRNMAGNLNTPVVLQVELAKSDSNGAHWALANRPNLSSEVRAALPPCAQGGPCFLGDLGPGGGVIVTRGRVIEIAPAGWNGQARDPQTDFCPSLSREALMRRIGTTARTMTVGIIAASGNRSGPATNNLARWCGPDSAAAAASAYRGGGFSDWLLPVDEDWETIARNIRELNLMERVELSDDVYWQSNYQYIESNGRLTTARVAGTYNPVTEESGRVSYDDRAFVRPIRIVN